MVVIALVKLASCPCSWCSKATDSSFDVAPSGVWIVGAGEEEEEDDDDNESLFSQKVKKLFHRSTYSSG